MPTRKKSRSTGSTKEGVKSRQRPRRSADNKNSPKNARSATVSKSVSRSTLSGPAQRGGPSTESVGDALAAKFDSTQKLAAEMQYNANKPTEHGKLSIHPQAGQTIAPSDPSATGSTVTEINASQK